LIFHPFFLSIAYFLISHGSVQFMQVFDGGVWQSIYFHSSSKTEGRYDGIL